MLDLTQDELQLVAYALDSMVKVDGLSHPQRYYMANQVVIKIKNELNRQANPEPEPEKPKKAAKK